MRQRAFPTLLLTFCCFFICSGQILYKVEGDKNEKPSYIFGSHHLFPLSIVEESGVMDYFNTTDRVVAELDLTIDPISLSLALQPYMLAPADSTLTIMLKNENIDSLNLQFEKWNPMEGLSLQMLDPLKPLAVSNMLLVGMNKEIMPDFDIQQQLDTYFMQQGKKEGKSIIALETPEYQGEVLYNGTPVSVQAEELIDILKNPAESLEMSRKLSQAYKERNIEEMLEMAEKDNQHPEFMQKLLYTRNSDWLDKLPAIIDEAPSFIVVGALHLAGPRGIINGLQEKGYRVTPIF